MEANQRSQLKKQPHVVIIMADQLRADFISPKFTPNIYQIAQQSNRLERTYCASPLCVPARGAFFTGQYPNETGCIINPWTPADQKHGHVKKDTPNLYKLLEEEWDSWHAGKQHLLTEEQFDLQPNTKTKWLPMQGRYQDYVKQQGKRLPGGAAFRGLAPEMAEGRTTRAKEYSIPTTGCYEEGMDTFFDGFILRDALHALKNRDTSKPLFLSAMFLAPHPPLDIPEPYYSMFKAEDMRLPANVATWSKNQSPLQLYNLTGAVGTGYTLENWREIWSVYAGLVKLLDDCVGELIAELKKQNIFEDTLLVVTSDHGEMLGSHQLWQKMCMYEESIHTPLYIKLPQQQNGKQFDALASAIDVIPTICDYLELPYQNQFSGKSLRPLLEEEKEIHKYIFIQFDGNGARGNFQRSVVNKQYKLIVDIFKDELFIELYDLAAEKQESVNLAFEATYKETIEAMLHVLREHMKSTEDLLVVPTDAYAEFLQRYGQYQEK
ncbi:sulfatase [Paenibacillus yanchengensis]|uniref:Sulfatase n=1 Tax=Paenibacillus yanchengensis TaxID=2035833 RepID=A0ABW4YNB7_9BACL